EPVHNSLLENASIWSHRGNWLTFKGQDYAWLKPTGGAFNVTIEKGQVLWAKKKVEWTLDYRGDAEKIVYSAAGNVLTRQVVTAGPASTPVKVKFRELPDTYRFTFDISPARIVVRDDSGNAIDEFVRPDPSVQLGKIGFRGVISVSIEQLH